MELVRRAPFGQPAPDMGMHGTFRCPADGQRQLDQTACLGVERTGLGNSRAEL